MKLFGQGKYEKAEFANGIGEEARFNQPCQGVFDEDENLCIRPVTTTAFAKLRQMVMLPFMLETVLKVWSMDYL